MDVLNITADPQVVAIVTFFCIGFVKLVDTAFDRDWRGCAKIIGSVAVGGVLALVIPDFSAVTGAAVGLAASGLITSASFIAKKSNPAVQDGPGIA